MAGTKLADRISALEAEVARLRGLVESGGRADTPWWEQIVGTFERDPAFRKAMQYGRDYRRSLIPKTTKGRRRRNGGARHRSY